MLQYNEGNNENKINNIEKGFNLKVMDFKRDLSKVIDNCNLPAIVVQLVLQEYTQEVSVQTQQIIQKEIQEYNKLKEENIDNTK